MSFLVIIIALIVVRYLHVDCRAYRNGWQEGYCSWVERHFRKSLGENGLLGYLLLLTPIVLAMIIVSLLLYHTMGKVGYFIFECLLLWFCLDWRDAAVEQYSVARLRGVFGIIFWFVILGPFGTLLYFVTESMGRYFTEHQLGSNTATFTQSIQGILDWVPARVLGLSVALVGSFAAVMKSWVHDLAEPLSKIPECVTRWCELAIEKAHVELAQQEKSALISLLDRALWVWLIIIALINIGMWVG